MAKPNRIAIVGGGPGGLMLARLLQLRGIAARVFERDTSSEERPQGGSLDIHGDSGQRAISLAGLNKEFLAAARPEDQGDRLYDPSGKLLFDHHDAAADRPEIDRSDLRRILLDSLSPGTVRWGCKVQAISPRANGSFDVVLNGSSERFDMVVGADGAWSCVRRLVSEAVPTYEGAVLVELGFDTARHPDVDRLVGPGKMFAVGDDRILIGQRNGQGRIRGYAGLRIPEASASEWTAATEARAWDNLRNAFAGWAPELVGIIDGGDFIAVRPLYALPIGHTWRSRSGITLLGDAAHLMSPFSGVGVNLALADAADLADAIASDAGWEAVTAYEAAMTDRAAPAAAGAAEGLRESISPGGAAAVLAHYREVFGAEAAAGPLSAPSA